MSTTKAEAGPCPMPPMSPEAAATQKVADRLVDLCSVGKNLDAIRELYDDNARHVEPMEAPGCPRITTGKKSILERAEQFARITTVHGSTMGKPSVNGDQFVLAMGLDCTCSEGPMANQRMKMNENVLYTVKNGKITEGKFFYTGFC